MSLSGAEGYVTDVTYTPGFYGNLAPLAIRYAASVNGLVPPPVHDGFRYLELGCGMGRSLTTLAAANPKGCFVGVDLNPEHTAFAERDAAAGGLTNVQLITSDFASLPADIGTFDFITLHGVLSWVAPVVRAQVLDILRRRLAPGGLVLVSYNAMPGWANRQPIRAILRQYAALRQGDSAQRVAEAAGYVAFLRDRGAQYFASNPAAAAYVDSLVTSDPRYLVHEYLNDHWTTFYFAEVAELFGGAGMSFVGSLPLHSNFWDLCVKPEFQELFHATGDRLVLEAHKDFCADTSFRWDIFTNGARPMRNVADRLRFADDVWFRRARPEATLPWQVQMGAVTATMDGPLCAAVLDVLADGARPLSAVLADERLAAWPQPEVVRSVDTGVATQLLDIVGGPVPAVRPCPPGSEIPALRVPSAFNRAVLASGGLGGQPVALASTCSGTGHAIGDLDAAFLHELAGGHGATVLERIDERLAAAGRSIVVEGKALADPDHRRKMVSDAFDRFCTMTVPFLAAMGVVELG